MAAAAARLSSRLVSFSLAPSVAGKTRLSDLNVKSRGPSLSKARKLNAGTERKRKSPLNNELTSRLAGEFLVVIGEPVTPTAESRQPTNLHRIPYPNAIEPVFFFFFFFFFFLRGGRIQEELSPSQVFCYA